VTGVLVLNQDYRVLAVARVPRALALIDRGKAEVLEHGVLAIQTPSCAIARPAVIRLVTYVRRPRPRVRFGRQNVFKRDGFTCQYCGMRPRDLTIDHILLVSRGGKDVWENVTTSCRDCNRRKGARTPAEARMSLRCAPFEPRITSFLHLTAGMDRPEWAPFLPVNGQY
jgi:5-methylcytosine-specific restriction endonuclease McrA